MFAALQVRGLRISLHLRVTTKMLSCTVQNTWLCGLFHVKSLIGPTIITRNCKSLWGWTWWRCAHALECFANYQTPHITGHNHQTVGLREHNFVGTPQGLNNASEAELSKTLWEREVEHVFFCACACNDPSARVFSLMLQFLRLRDGCRLWLIDSRLDCIFIAAVPESYRQLVRTELLSVSSLTNFPLFESLVRRMMVR